MKNKILWFIVCILVAETVVLTLVNKDLRKKLNTCRYVLYTPSLAIEKSRKPIVPNFKVKDIQDDKSGYLFDQVSHENILLFMFSTDCPHCDEMAENWNDIYDRFQDDYTVIGISEQPLKKMKEYIYRNNILFPVVQVESLADFGFFSFPQSILTNPQGQIKKNINGYSDELITEFKLKIFKEEKL